MKPIFFALCILAAVPLAAAPTIGVPAGIDHTEWGRLLDRYVDDQGLVDYSAWRESESDLQALDQYLAQYALQTGVLAEGHEESAALVNAYNAFTIQWILENYPTESIRLLEDSWKEKRHTIGGKQISLDEIEHENLRPLMGWRVHALIVCAARSCPPLYDKAFSKENFADEMDARYRVWLARSDLNRFDPKAKRIQVSKIFKWFKEDFTEDGRLRKILTTYAPKQFERFLQSEEYAIEYLDYHWGLNDQSDLGKDYEHSFWGSIF